jgi:hypothetical protein
MDEATIYQVQRSEQEIKDEVGTLLHVAETLQITTVADKEAAVIFTREINDTMKKVREYFKPMKEAAAAAHLAIVAREQETLEIPQRAKEITLEKITDYDHEQDRIRKEEESRLREEVRKRHEKQLARAQKKIDQFTGLNLDIDETIELLEMELKDEDLSETERMAYEREIGILQAKRNRNDERIAEIEQQSVQPPVFIPTVSPAETKVKGSVRKKEVVMQIVDEAKVARAVADGLLPIKCIKIVESELKKFILQHDGRKTIPGVTFQITSKTHVR